MTISKERIAEIVAISDEDIDTSDIPEVTEIFDCVFCNKSIVIYFAPDNGGIISKPDYTLLGNWVAHVDCLNKSLDDYYREQNKEVESE